MMSPDFDPDAREKLVRLLHGKLGDSDSFDNFRIALEELYNFRLDRRSLPPEEQGALEELFDTVAYYSPLIYERTKIPIYRSEDDVVAAVAKARRVFSKDPATFNLMPPEKALLRAVVAKYRPDLMELVESVGTKPLSDRERESLINSLANARLNAEARGSATDEQLGSQLGRLIESIKKLLRQ